MKKPGFEPPSDSAVKASSTDTTLATTRTMNDVYIAPDTSELVNPPDVPETWAHPVLKLHNRLEVRQGFGPRLSFSQ